MQRKAKRLLFLGCPGAWKVSGICMGVFKDNDINIEYTDEDMELIAKYPVDFLSFTYYRSRNCIEGLCGIRPKRDK